jgi:hypothetical protein
MRTSADFLWVYSEASTSMSVFPRKTVLHARFVYLIGASLAVGRVHAHDDFKGSEGTGNAESQISFHRIPSRVFCMPGLIPANSSTISARRRDASAGLSPPLAVPR